MSDQDKIRELEKRIEKLEERCEKLKELEERYELLKSISVNIPEDENGYFG